MSALAGCLVALMVWFGERAVHGLRRERVRERLGGPDGPATPRRGRLPSFGGWLPWVVPGTLLAWLLLAPWAAPLGAGAAVLVRRAIARRREARRRTSEDEQLADAVGALAAAVRAGQSLPQAFAYAAAETPPPLGVSICGMVDAVDVGVPIESALDVWAADLGTSDARLVAGVLRLHRRSGGDLPVVLDHVGLTLRDRRAAGREVRALTAQARLSGAILGFLPIAFFAFLWLTSRSDIEGAFRTPAGLVAIAAGLAMEGVAFLWIRHLLEVA